MSDPFDLLAGSGGKSARFETIGDTVTGRVTEDASLIQRRSFETGDPLTWDDGSPQLQLPVRLETDQADPTDPEDDGTRSVYVKWYGPQRKALEQALRQAGLRGVPAGATFTATYVADQPPTRRGFSPAKLFEYRVTPPPPQGAPDLLDTPARQQAAPSPAAGVQAFADALGAQPVAGQQQHVAGQQPMPMSLTPAQVAQLQAQGVQAPPF